jgi:hypothetical protein
LVQMGPRPPLRCPRVRHPATFCLAILWIAPDYFVKSGLVIGWRGRDACGAGTGVTNVRLKWRLGKVVLLRLHSRILRRCKVLRCGSLCSDTGRSSESRACAWGMWEQHHEVIEVIEVIEVRVCPGNPGACKPPPDCPNPLVHLSTAWLCRTPGTPAPRLATGAALCLP